MTNCDRINGLSRGRVKIGIPRSLGRIIGSILGVAGGTDVEHLGWPSDQRPD